MTVVKSLSGRNFDCRFRTLSHSLSETVLLTSTTRQQHFEKRLPIYNDDTFRVFLVPVERNISSAITTSVAKCDTLLEERRHLSVGSGPSLRRARPSDFPNGPKFLLWFLALMFTSCSGATVLVHASSKMCLTNLVSIVKGRKFHAEISVPLKFISKVLAPR
jgi:hypothetical protein